MTYKLIKDVYSNTINTVQKTNEQGIITCIPFDPDNTDYQEYLKWVAEGNTPEEAE